METIGRASMVPFISGVPFLRVCFRVPCEGFLFQGLLEGLREGICYNSGFPC